jgi:hypothetical protein
MASLEEQFGPIYPDLGSGVAKFRKRGPIAKMAKADRRAYGEAVETAIRAKQRQALMREGTSPRSFEPIGDARVQRQRQALQAAVASERREREPDEWKKMYEAAMKEKAERAAAPPPAPKPAPQSAGLPFEVVKIKGRLIVKAPVWTIGNTPPTIAILRNALRCKYSYRDEGYIATAAKLEKLNQMLNV